MKGPKEEFPVYDDLSEIDLAQLDLDHIQIEEQSFSGKLVRRIGALFILSSLGFLLWLPSSQLYTTDGGSHGLVFGLSLLSILLAFIGGRWLWDWLEIRSKRLANKWARETQQEPQSRPPPSALERWLTLFGAMGGIGLVLVAQNNGLPGLSSSANGYLVPIGALGVAILGGRWLFIQANREPDPNREAPVKFEFPHWFKWATLSILVAGAVVAGFGNRFISYGSYDASIFGALAFLVGTGGAVWLARRFDDWEQKFKESRRNNEENP